MRNMTKLAIKAFRLLRFSISRLTLRTVGATAHHQSRQNSYIYLSLAFLRFFCQEYHDEGPLEIVVALFKHEDNIDGEGGQNRKNKSCYGRLSVCIAWNS